MRTSFAKASDLDLYTLANLFNDAFQGYVGGEVQFNAASLAHFLALEGIDLSLSNIALQNDRPVALALIARIGRTSRLAAMGVAKSTQGQGVGKSLLDHSFEQARRRGDRLYTLECIEQNERGVRLYRGAGFRTVRRLLSYRFEHSNHPLEGPPTQPVSLDDLQEIDIAIVARLVAYHGVPDLPWQVSGHSLARLGPPNIAFSLGPAYAILSSPEGHRIVLRGFFVLPGQRSRGFGRRLMGALVRRYPRKDWMIPALCPEEYGGFFERIGFEPDQLSQFQMEKPCIPQYPRSSP